MVMNGKKGLIVGVANNKSIAYGIAKACKEQGADIAYTFLNEALEKRVRSVAEELGSDKIYPLDVSNPAEIADVVKSVEKILERLTFWYTRWLLLQKRHLVNHL